MLTKVLVTMFVSKLIDSGEWMLETNLNMAVIFLVTTDSYLDCIPDDN